MAINSFNGKYRFLSNFYGTIIYWRGRMFPSVENAFQADKCELDKDTYPFAFCTAAEAKRLGRSVKLRPDWEKRKLGTMLELLRYKFREHPKLQRQLLATGGEKLIEGNTWGDRYWGVCDGEGLNMLGILLMLVREEIRHDAKYEITDEISELTPEQWQGIVIRLKRVS